MRMSTMVEKFRGVAIGAGYFSHFHYEAWARIPEVELVAFSDRDPAKAQVVTEKFGPLKFYSDWREMLEREKPDFVDIITPPSSHREICAEAGRRGIHIICQKPLAPSFAEARAIVSGAASHGVRFMVHENFRFQPWHREIRRQLARGAIGKKLHSLAFRSRMGDGWGEHAYIPRQPYFREYPQLLVYETGVHFIDTFRSLAGEITRVAAWLRRLNPEIKGEDCGLLIFEFANGAVGQWDANRYNEPPAGADPRYTFGEFLLEGDAGALRLDLHGRLVLQKLGGPETEISYAPPVCGFAGDCVYATQRHFIDRLLDGGSFETSGADYLKTLAVQEAVYAAATSRQAVTVHN
jgi:D-apiose dehydrogenase